MFKTDKKKSGLSALERQSKIVNESGFKPNEQEKTYLSAYSYDSGPFVNDYLRYGKNVNYPADYFPEQARIAQDSHERTTDLLKVVDSLPSTGGVTLYRGGSGKRGTSGVFFRAGKVKVGDMLINTDFTSFTESQAIANEFAIVHSEDGGCFDDTSVIFELNKYSSVKVMAPFSMRSMEPYLEAESLVSPGHVFKVCAVNIISVNSSQSYVEVKLEEVDRIKPSIKRCVFLSTIEFPDNVYDLRTGESIDIELLIERLGLEEMEKLGLL